MIDRVVDAAIRAVAEAFDDTGPHGLWVFLRTEPDLLRMAVRKAMLKAVAPNGEPKLRDTLLGCKHEDVWDSDTWTSTQVKPRIRWCRRCGALKIGNEEEWHTPRVDTKRKFKASFDIYEDQHAKLKKLGDITRRPFSSFFREGIDLVLERHAGAPPATEVQPNQTTDRKETT